MSNNEINTSKNNKGMGLAVSSTVISIIGLVPTIISLILCLESILVLLKPDTDLGDGIGAAVMIILYMPIVIVAFVLSAISLGLGIGSLAKCKSNKVKSFGISGTVISAVCVIISVISFIVRVAI